jgi:hypothetical protein
MSPEILRIEGLPQALSFLGTFPNTLTTKIDTEVNTIGDNGAKNIKGKAHRQTGRMANSVSKSKKGKMSVSIDVKVGYAGYENRKGNPHNFFDQGVNEITKDAQSRIPTVINGLIK